MRTCPGPAGRPIRRAALLLLPLPALLLLGCAPQQDTSSDATSSATRTGTGSATTGSASAASCATGSLHLLHAGQLTVGTDSPAYDPWFADNDPTNGKGYESAVAYAVADRLGFDADQVHWVKVPFNTSYAPGDKDFDFDINQISITPARAKVVDFSDGYYSAAQAVVALKSDKISGATSLADLAAYKLGAQTGTTSLTAVRDDIRPSSDPAVFETTNDAKQALLNGQIDGLVVDLPTAFYITAAEIKGSTIVGQFQPVSGQTEQFGMLFAKGDPLVTCVDQALAALKADGTLAALQQKWLADKVNVPVLK